jgi:hypothetical protein
MQPLLYRTARHQKFYSKWFWHLKPQKYFCQTFPSAPDLANTLNAARANNVITWLPGINGAGGIEVYNGQQFWATGPNAIYLMYTYGIGITPPDSSGYGEIPLDRRYLRVIQTA